MGRDLARGKAIVQRPGVSGRAGRCDRWSLVGTFRAGSCSRRHRSPGENGRKGFPWVPFSLPTESLKQKEVDDGFQNLCLFLKVSSWAALSAQPTTVNRGCAW